MKTGKNIGSALTALAAVLCLTTTASANSSWVWLTDARPGEVLPFTAAATVAIEFCAIYFIGRSKRPWKTLLVVVLANLVSFLGTYLVMKSGNAQTGHGVWDRGCFVGLLFLIATVAIELPITYYNLNKDVESTRRLLWTAVLVNAATTVMCAVVERIFCEGHW